MPITLNHTWARRSGRVCPGRSRSRPRGFLEGATCRWELGLPSLPSSGPPPRRRGRGSRYLQPHLLHPPATRRGWGRGDPAMPWGTTQTTCLFSVGTRPRSFQMAPKTPATICPHCRETPAANSCFKTLPRLTEPTAPTAVPCPTPNHPGCGWVPPLQTGNTDSLPQADFHPWVQPAAAEKAL